MKYLNIEQIVTIEVIDDDKPKYKVVEAKKGYRLFGILLGEDTDKHILNIKTGLTFKMSDITEDKKYMLVGDSYFMLPHVKIKTSDGNYHYKYFDTIENAEEFKSKIVMSLDTIEIN